MVNQGADPSFYVNPSVFGPATLLTLAVKNANVEVVKLLLAAGADPSFKLPDGMNALNIAQDMLDSAEENKNECMITKMTAIKKLLEAIMVKK